MRIPILAFFLLFTFCTLSAQPTFKCGWTTYKTTAIIHEYTYNYTYSDSVRLYLIDSSNTFVAPDSAATLTVNYGSRDKAKSQVANYYNAKKKVVKTEEYRDNLVQAFKEYKYDDKNRKIYQYDENKTSNNNFKKTFDYGTDKATGDFITSEISYFNGRVEFYTKTYYDKNNRRYKEVRLNDNNKDVVHVENFYYNEAGKLKERSVFFPEFKVTKKFTEPGGDVPAKCFKTQLINVPEKPSLSTKIGFVKRLLTKNMSMLFDKDCTEFEYLFKNADCEVLVATTKTNNIKQVTFRFREKVL